MTCLFVLFLFFLLVFFVILLLLDQLLSSQCILFLVLVFQEVILRNSREVDLDATSTAARVNDVGSFQKVEILI